MDIYDSGGVTNRIRTRSVIVALAVYAFVAVFTAGLALIPCAILWWVGYAIAQREIRRVSGNASEFIKSYPFRYFGNSYGAFSHVYEHEAVLDASVLGAIEHDLRHKTPVDGLREITITDVDKDLRASDSRAFHVTRPERTSYGTEVTLLLRFASFGAMRSIQWWVLAGGYIDRDKLFGLSAYTPLTIWFWIIPYLKKNHDLLRRIRTVYSSTYNELDVEDQVKSLHHLVFNALIGELDRHGVDTSDLKIQRMQVMSITISGGQVNMGNVVQGAMNKVMANASAKAG